MKKERLEVMNIALEYIQETCGPCPIKATCKFGYSALKTIGNMPSKNENEQIGRANAVAYVWVQRETSPNCPTPDHIKYNAQSIINSLQS
jgi:hypothetical protein